MKRLLSGPENELLHSIAAVTKSLPEDILTKAFMHAAHCHHAWAGNYREVIDLVTSFELAHPGESEKKQALNLA
jgi:hypothetical protein